MNLSQTGLPEHAIAQIQAVLARHPEVERAVLYGSRAKGNFKSGSDIDLTLFGAELTLAHQLKLMDELDELLLPWMIDLSLYASLKHSALEEHIQRVGILFYQRMNLV